MLGRCHRWLAHEARLTNTESPRRSAMHRHSREPSLPNDLHPRRISAAIGRLRCRIGKHSLKALAGCVYCEKLSSARASLLDLACFTRNAHGSPALRSIHQRFRYPPISSLGLARTSRSAWIRSCRGYRGHGLPCGGQRVLIIAWGGQPRSVRCQPEVQQMDDRQFDALVRSLAAGRSRRQVLKGMLGLGGAAAATAAALPDQADAARRGYSGPKFPTACVPNCDGTTCGANGCGGTCPCRQGLVCISGTGLCAWPCFGSGQCSGDCHCDLENDVCASNQLGGSCSQIADCPTGTFCSPTGFNTRACVAPCTDA